MAEVYKAYHPGLECYVAIKVLHPFLAGEKDFLARFEREAKVVATFRHPNIVQVYDYESNVEDRCYYMVMEFIDGPSLKTRLQQMAEEGRRLALDEAIQIVIAVANALDYAHRHGMVHRDIKPANIMFTQDGQTILTDFGIARMVDTTPLTASGAMVGTPAYMAPEQGMGQVRDERADIYSLGVMFYQLVTGDLPFDADTPMAIVLKHIHAPLLSPTTLDPSLPPAVETVIVRALAKDPDKRYQTAKDLADDLERYLAGEPVAPVSPEIARSSVTAPLPRLPAPRARPRRSWIGVLAAVLVLGLLGSAALLTTDKPSRLMAALLAAAATPTSDAIGTPTHTPPPDLTATYEADATRFAAWMSTYVATVGVTPTSSPTPSPTPTSTPTPDLTVTALAACIFDMQVINDPPVWPSVLMPGQRFVKRWTIRNVGTCTWPEDIQLVLVSGDELHVVAEPQIQPLSPEETAEIESTLQAPTAYDRYTSAWQLQDSAGNPIGEQLEATCRVGATPSPRPTTTPTATSTPEFTPTPTEPLHFSVPIVVDWRDQRDGTWWGQVGLTAWGGDGTYRYYLNSISEENEFFNGAFEIESRTCLGWWGTVIVTSADEVARWEGKVEYPDPDDCE